MMTKKSVIALIALRVTGPLCALDPREVISGCQANFDRIQDIQAEVSVTIEGGVVADHRVGHRSDGAAKTVKIKRPRKRRDENGETIQVRNNGTFYFKNGGGTAVTVAAPAEVKDLLLEPDVIFCADEMLGSLHLEMGKEWTEGAAAMCRIDVYESSTSNQAILMRYYVDATASVITKIELFDAKGNAYRTFELDAYVAQNGVSFPQEIVETIETKNRSIVRRTQYNSIDVNVGLSDGEFSLE